MTLTAKVFKGCSSRSRKLTANVRSVVRTHSGAACRSRPQARPERVSEVQGILDQLVDPLVQSDEDRLDTMEW